MKIKDLSIYISNFKDMIQGNYLYIDKTEYIYKLFKGYKHYYFLSRPRRFGKSLLLSTLKELFLGNKELFKDLWIYSSDYKWQEYPVIYLDFSIIPHLTAQELRRSLNNKLKEIAQEHNINLNYSDTPEESLTSLIKSLSQKNPVVILIDEYDKPILDHLKNIEQAQEQRNILKSFYDIIKESDQYLRAVFLTGVSRFSKTSLFSGINNLNDISLKPETAQLLDYTQQELEMHFRFYIESFANKLNISNQELLKELKNWYNGYRFSKENIYVYNPFSVLYSLNDKDFINYWFESGTPTFLIHLMSKQYYSIENIDQEEVSQETLGNFDIDNIPLVPLLFQTGYLTIADYDQATQKFKLKFPNYEVKYSFTKFLVPTLSHSPAALVNT